MHGLHPAERQRNIDRARAEEIGLRQRLWELEAENKRLRERVAELEGK